MRIALDIPDADVVALSVQLGARFTTDVADGETAAAHVTRAVQAWAAQERVAARKIAAQRALADVEANPDATTAQREAAALAEYRTRR